MSDLTYTELASRYEVDLCDERCGQRGHDRGFTGSGMLHWRERQVVRLGLYRFLKLVGAIHLRREGRIAGSAQAIYLVNAFAYQTALKDLRIRFPRRYSAEDRARVRFQLRSASYQDNRRALDWAGRS